MFAPVRFTQLWEPITSLPERSFLRVEDLPGVSRIANQIMLEEAVAAGLIVRVRRGLYYKGAPTRYGMKRPAVEEIVREVLGEQGVGPSKYSAARMLGLTTQIPAKYEVASLHPPKVIDGVLMHQRSNVMRGLLNEREIAALEVLRAPDIYVESGWDALVAAIRQLIEGGTVRKALLLEVAAAENHGATRRNARRLELELQNTFRSETILESDGGAR